MHRFVGTKEASSRANFSNCPEFSSAFSMLKHAQRMIGIAVLIVVFYLGAADMGNLYAIGLGNSFQTGWEKTECMQ